MARDMSVGRFFAGPNAFMVAALSAAAIVLVSAAVIGARNADDSARAITPAERSDRVRSDTGGLEADEFGAEQGGPDAADPASRPGGAPGTAAPGSRGGATTGTGGGGGNTGGGGGGSQALPSEPGATRQGIYSDRIEIGAHAPITFDGQPLNLAEDPIVGFKGYITYLNKNGGVHGRKIRLFLEDDRYTTQGGEQAGTRLVDKKPFLIEGTLGIDQIHKVALAAKSAGIPYMAGGGPEAEFNGLMYQIISNYDQYADMMVQFICKYGKQYVGENEVRVGSSTLNSEFILPVRDRMLKKLGDRGCVAPVDGNAQQTVIKPTEETRYAQKMLQIRNSYNNKGANLLIPLQDPITTGREVAELKAYKAQGYDPKWHIANFAHDSNTALTLMGGEWTGDRIISGGCYYLSDNAYNPALCARMKDAHEQWVSLGHVRYDENAGGNAGGKSEYTYDENSWKKDGSGGAAGYQLTYFWHGALQSIGPDPTREKFLGALNAYENYSNLVTGPITFKGSSNFMVGATRFALYEGTGGCTKGEADQFCYRQVMEITPQLVDQF